MEKMNDISSEILAVIGDVFFSFSYVLRIIASRRSEKDTIPVKKCVRKEIREKATIKKVAFDLLEEMYFKKKSSEKKKNMYPRLFGTEMVPQ